MDSSHDSHARCLVICFLLYPLSTFTKGACFFLICIHDDDDDDDVVVVVAVSQSNSDP